MGVLVLGCIVMWVDMLLCIKGLPRDSNTLTKEDGRNYIHRVSDLENTH